MYAVGCSCAGEIAATAGRCLVVVERGGAELHAAYGADEEAPAFYDLAWTPDGTKVRPAKYRWKLPDISI